MSNDTARSVSYAPILDRNRLRGILVRRQMVRGVSLCPVCLRGLYGDAEIHEAIIKRGDLPNDTRIFAPINCVVVHKQCHANTRLVDERAKAYLLSHYGLQQMAEWILSLGLKSPPGRASAILRAAKSTLRI